ncbi:hypothetical protein CBL_00453 [Carabus blaptoides fortunei]
MLNVPLAGGTELWRYSVNCENSLPEYVYSHDQYGLTGAQKRVNSSLSSKIECTDVWVLQPQFVETTNLLHPADIPLGQGMITRMEACGGGQVPLAKSSRLCAGTAREETGTQAVMWMDGRIESSLQEAGP